MGFSVDYPLSITPRGGCRTTDQNLGGVLVLSVLPGTSSNPYNDRDGVGMLELVWEPNSVEQEASVVARLTRRFDELERQDRASLNFVRKVVPIGGDDGQAVYLINWDDLENGQAGLETILPSRT